MYAPYLGRVDDLPASVAKNITSMLTHKLGREPGVSDLMKLGFANGTAQRFLEGGTSVGLKLLQRVALSLGLQPWQLLTTDLDPKDLPAVVSGKSRPGWPFEFETRRYDALLPKEQGMVEHAARVELERIEQKRGGAAAISSPSEKRQSLAA